MIPYSTQTILNSDIKGVNKVLKSKWLTQGPLVKKFELRLSKVVKSKYAVAVNSGTSALHVSCLALGLKPRDILWTVPNTFVASANQRYTCYCELSIITQNISHSSLCRATSRTRHYLAAFQKI